MIRQCAFTKEHSMLKGGLHCHTTRSDGRGTPEEVERLHARHGYDFLALTDHNFYNYADYAPEAGLLIVPGMEIDAVIDSDLGLCFHSVCIGPARENGNGFAQDQRPEHPHVKTWQEFQTRLDQVHAAKNLTLYCHPDWSRTPARSFENLQGNFAMEIWNTGCVMDNDMDKDAYAWDEVLLDGHKIFGAATDDGHAMNQHCGGYVMVNAEKNLDDILRALSQGAFYSSTGPEIYDFYIDGDRAVVECSPCQFVGFINGTQPNRLVRNAGGLVTRAEIKLPEETRYLRATMVDAEGRRAWTNPIFLDERR
ncbi:MAG: hypothetical protein Q4C31_05985 [Eubacteriales bacterium]|nr:hypothetical protein [Eubacteriales bacterium]